MRVAWFGQTFSSNLGSISIEISNKSAKNNENNENKAENPGQYPFAVRNLIETNMDQSKLICLGGQTIPTSQNLIAKGEFLISTVRLKRSADLIRMMSQESINE